MNRSILFALALFLTPSLALASPADEKLGEEYAKASPTDKLLMITYAKIEKKLNYKEANASISEVFLAKIKEGSSPKERLEKLGELRKSGKAKNSAVSKERRAEKKKTASFIEPDSNIQLALALHYIGAAVGGKPSVEALGVLALVRECTSWGSTGKLVVATIQEAFARDEAFMKGNLKEKLGIIKKTAEDRKMLSNFGRNAIENTVLAEWMAAELKGGKSAADIRSEVKDLKSRNLICFFTSNWADGMLKRLAEIQK